MECPDNMVAIIFSMDDKVTSVSNYESILRLGLIYAETINDIVVNP